MRSAFNSCVFNRYMVHSPRCYESQELEAHANKLMSGILTMVLSESDCFLEEGQGKSSRSGGQ